jgi:general stress protein YciG
MVHKKNPHAVALGRAGGRKRAENLSQEELSTIAKKGGQARKESLTPAERKASARKAAKARWNRKKEEA